MKTELPADIASARPSVQAFYLRRLAEGCGPLFAEMIALQQAPKCGTDKGWFANFGTLEDQFKGDENALAQITANSVAGGYKPGVNDVYYPAIASYPGDPKAFVSQAHGVKNHIKNLCEERGSGSEGIVNIKAQEPEHDPLEKGHVAPDICDRIIGDWSKKDPDITRKATRRELHEEVQLKHAPK
jgi:hypothetical protein